MSDMGLSISASGLAASAAELNTASNNLANVSTPGYATESVNLSPEAAGGPLNTGQGVIVGSISRLSDAIYAAVSVAAAGVQGAAAQSNQVMSSIQTVFPEPSTNGIAAQLSTFWSSVATLASNPNQVGAEQAVAGAAQNVALTLNNSSAQLNQLSNSLQGSVGSGAGDGGTLARVNSLLQQVAQLNAQIVAGAVSGQNANALVDQSTAAVNKLAGLIGLTSTNGPHGTVALYSNGVQLVGGNIAQTLSTTGSAATANLSITTANGVTVNAGGSIGATLTAVNTTIPGYQSQLNAVADALATSVNTVQANGMSASGVPGSAIAGGATALPNIFVNNGSSSTYTTSPPAVNSAATIEVAPALVANPALVATAAAPGPGNANVIGTATMDGSNAQVMAALASSATGPDVTYQTMIGALGTQAANALTTSNSAQGLLTTASNNLSTITGVDPNTQEVNILTAQNAFQANSKVINAINACFQSLIAAV
ncbi:MAG: flagellar hook-associated protein FlgK [Acidimicrobiales bacterium]